MGFLLLLLQSIWGFWIYSVVSIHFKNVNKTYILVSTVYKLPSSLNTRKLQMWKREIIHQVQNLSYLFTEMRQSHVDLISKYFWNKKIKPKIKIIPVFCEDTSPISHCMQVPSREKGHSVLYHTSQLKT